MRTGRHKVIIGLVVTLILAIGMSAAVLFFVGRDDDSAQQQDEPDLTTRLIEQRPLAEYLEITGTLDYAESVTLSAQTSGVLTYLAPEGTVVNRGDSLYQIVDEPTLDDMADTLERLASARNSLVTAQDKLSDALTGPSASDVAAARAELSDAIQTRDRLLEPPSEAEVASREAAIAKASEVLDTLLNPSPATQSEARSKLSVAQSDLAELRNGASQAQIDEAWAVALTARERFDAISHYPEDWPERATAEADLALAYEAIDELVRGASEAELEAAEAAVMVASETLDALLSPSESSRITAQAELSDAQEALDDLLAGPTTADINTTEAAVLAAEDALAELLAGHSTEEIEAFEAAVASAKAAVVSAEADVATLDNTHSSLVVMYGSTAAYRTMSVGLSGEDIRQLEENLEELGYGNGDDFSVDGVLDDATVTAVKAWQEAIGQNPDGTVGVDDIIFVTGPVRVGSWSQDIEVGKQLSLGSSLASLTVTQAPVNGVMTTTQRVVALLPLSNRDLISEGSIVNVELPDQTNIEGTISTINPSPVLDSQTDENAVEVTVFLAEPAPEVWIGATVDVEITETLIEDALVVPATALLVLVEGGYAVEILAEDGSMRLVGVEPGLFVDGDVEVLSAELSAGMTVVVPR